MSNRFPAAGRCCSGFPGKIQRPERELKAFASVALEAGETREVVLTVRRSDLAYWDIRLDAWVVEGGEYVVDVAASSRDIRSSVTVAVDGDPVVLPLSRTSSIGEVMAHPVVGQMVQAAIAQMMGGMEGVEAIMPEGVDASKQVMPGDNVEMVCELHQPHVLEQGQRFNMREGGRTVATGLVTRVLA